MTRKLFVLVVLLINVSGVLLFTAPLSVFAGLSDEFLMLGPPGVASNPPDMLRVAAQLNNISRKTAATITIDSIQLDSASPLTRLPIAVGEIAAGRSVTIQADFNSNQLTQGKQYQLVVRGSYQLAQKGEDEYKGPKLEGKRHEFILKRMVTLPPAAPGSGTMGTVTVPSKNITGAPFPHRSPSFDNDVNKAAPPVPTAPFVPSVSIPAATGVMPAPFGDPPPIVFNINNGMGLTSAGINCGGDASAVCAEPSGAATGGGVVFATVNWVAAYSTDGGTTFTQVDPTRVFPADAVGFCCDQIVQYVPSIDRFIWLLQGNGYRLAMASPADIINSGGTAWTYWNLTPQLFGEPAGTGFDYPDLAVGGNALYISWNGNGGFQVARVPLAGIQGGGTITIDYTHPSDSPSSIT